MGVFDRLVTQKRAAITAEQNRILQSDQELRDRVHLRAPVRDFITEDLVQERMYYGNIEDYPVNLMMPPVRGTEKSLVPSIDEKGMSKYRRKKVRKGILKDYGKAVELVGEMGTSQTIPLMRSMKANAKEIAKKKEQEKSDLIELSQLDITKEIGSDIFDLSITKDQLHTHFDVKKALIVKNKLDKIKELKETNSREYNMLDFDTSVRLEYLLEVGDAFAKTLKVVLAANGLSETGEPLQKDSREIREGREAYSSYKDAFREMIDQKDTFMQEKRDAMKAEREAAFRISGNYKREKTEKKDAIINNWDSLGREQLPENYKKSDYYSRVTYRMTDDEQQNLERIQLSIDAYNLHKGQMAGAERDALFESIKARVVPEYNEFRKRIPEMAEKLKKANINELCDMVEEILAFEMPLQHLSDILKNSKNSKGESIKDQLHICKAEDEQISQGMFFLSLIRSQTVLFNTYKAAVAGVGVNINDLDVNMYKRALGYKDAAGNVDLSRLVPELKEQIERTINTMNGEMSREAEEKKTAYEAQKAEVERVRGLSGDMAREAEGLPELQDFLEKHGGNIAAYLESYVDNNRKVSRQNVKPLWDAFKASRFRDPDNVGGDADPVWRDFKRTLRELFGGSGTNLDAPSDDMTIDLDEKDVSLKKVQELLEHPDEQTIAAFMAPLTEFEGTDMVKSLDDCTQLSVEQREDTIGRLIAGIRPLNALNQWSQVFLTGDLISPALKEKIARGVNRYNMVTGLAFTLANTSAFTEFHNINAPGMKDVITCTDHATELTDIRTKLVADMEAEHVINDYTYDELRQYRFYSTLDLKGLIGAEDHTMQAHRKLPMTREEMQKISDADTDFIQEMSQKVSGFTLLGKFGRPRVLANSDAGDIMTYGAEDLKYYSEMARSAKFILMSKDCDEAKVKQALGKDAEKILGECRRIIAIQYSLETKLLRPMAVQSMMDDDCKGVCGETLRDISVIQAKMVTDYKSAEEREIRSRK